jgi:hypothetical protein
MPFQLQKAVRDVVDEVWDTFSSSVRTEMYTNIIQEQESLREYDRDLEKELDKHVDSTTDNVSDNTKDQLSVCIWYRYWSGWLQGGKILGVQYDEERYHRFLRWTTHVPVIFANDEFPIVSMFPTEVHWQNGVLHNENGPSVMFPSGYSMWNIESVPVDEQIVMHPETQTIEEINQEDNEEVRRIRINRFTWLQYLEKSNAKVVDKRKNDIDNQIECLVVDPVGTKRLIVSDPSTARKYVLGVPSEVMTCEEAQSWINHGLKIIHRS